MTPSKPTVPPLHFFDDENEMVEVMSNETTTVVVTPSAGRDPPKAVQAASNGVVSAGPTVLNKLRNTELESGEWENSIIWDDQVAPSAPLPTELILDLSDTYMFPDDPFKQQSKAKMDVAVVPPSRGKKRKESEEDEKLDRFNLSNDRYYRPSEKGNSVRQSSKKMLVMHSDPGWKLSTLKPNLTNEELPRFHRPRVTVYQGERVKFGAARKEKTTKSIKSTGPVLAHTKGEMRQKVDLSAKDGRLLLAEYIEEVPLLVSNYGMGTKIRNYYRKKNSSENPLLPFTDGENVLLDPADDSPFLGDVEPGKAVQAMDNNLFRAPMFKHVVPETDFLVVKPTAQGKKAVIREIPSVYTVGQVQPKLEVPAPNSRVANAFVKNRLQAYIYRLLTSKPTAVRVNVSELVSLFPGNTDASIRKKLKECADVQRGGEENGWWAVRDQSQLPSEDELRQLVSPEMVCMHESMLYGQYKLQQAGIRRLTNMNPGFGSAMQQLEQESNEALARAGKLLEEELLLTPWNLTSNFVNAAQGKGMLQLTGQGDPSGRGEAFSYLKMPQKTFNPEKRKKDMPKAAVSGTDADLRKLSLENAARILREYGVPESEIDKLGRWERIGMVRKLSSEAALAGERGSTKFARGSRYSMQQQQQQYREQAQLIFDNQVRALSEPNPDVSDDEESNELDDFGTALESFVQPKKKAKTYENVHQKKAVQEEEDEAERKELEQFLEQEKKDEAKPAETLQSGQKQRVVRRTVKSILPDGTQTERVELITDPKEVEELIRKQREKEKKKLFAQTKSKKGPKPLAPEECTLY